MLASILDRFGLRFGSILGPFWAPRSIQNRTKNQSKIKLQRHASTGPPRETLRPPQELPRPPQDRPKSSQDHPKSLPNSPKRAQTPCKKLQDRPKKPSDHRRVIDSELCSIIIIFLQNKNFGSSPEAIKEIQEAAKINELLSLHTSEPPGLRVPAAKCLGGCREAQTILTLMKPSPLQQNRLKT